jgi:hypothetical protein
MKARELQKHLFTGRWRGVTATTPDKEVAMQIQLVSLLRWCLRPDVIMRHVPNGELRDKRTAAKLKAMGVLAGSADLEFFWKEIDESEGETRKYFRALFLELKLPGKSATDAQIEFALAMRLLGAEFAVARSIDEAIAELKARDLLRADRKIFLLGAKS